MNDVGITTECWSSTARRSSSRYQGHPQCLHGETDRAYAESMSLHVTCPRQWHAKPAERLHVIIVPIRSAPLVELKERQRWVWCSILTFRADPASDVSGANRHLYDAASFPFPNMHSRSMSHRFIMPHRPLLLDQQEISRRQLRAP